MVVRQTRRNLLEEQNLLVNSCLLEVMWGGERQREARLKKR